MTWTRETALEGVAAFASSHGYQPIYREAGEHNGLPPEWVIRKLFGSWNEMIRLAGFDPYPARNARLAKTLVRRDRARARLTDAITQLYDQPLGDVAAGVAELEMSIRETERLIEVLGVLTRRKELE